MQKYVCKNCDAELYWDVASGCLKCEYCDSKYKPSDFQDSTSAPHAEAQARRAEEGQTATDDTLNENSLVVYKCMHCGAEIITAAGTVATTCGYCGRAIAFANKLQDEFKPLAIIPFSVTKKNALQILEKYLKRSWLTPRKYIEGVKTTKIVGMYCPYWLHSYDCEATAEIECIERHDKSTTRHMVDISGHATFKYIPTDALSHIDDELTNAIEPFNYSNAKKFDPAFMAGFYSERFNENAEDAFQKSRKKSEIVMRHNLETKVGRYDETNIKKYYDRVTNYALTNVMLPIWIVHTEYAGKKYTYAINGDTGVVAGDIPVSNLRWALMSFGAGAIVLLFSILSNL